ncbi:FHA domain-containing protein FhaB/FipA [Demequina sediminicola]|uniref:FHA domain-containing protein FhaB/FipA n=1 Tax=Demequina sediminicola TaxID=1095026 RepID=UPI0007855287|nr:FHA domain-containing protein [Demequina sediminicola]
MSELSITVLRFGFLILLWALVLSSIAVLRADLYGTRVTSRGKGRNKRRDDARADKVAAPSRSATGVRTGSISTSSKAVGHLAVISGPLKGTTIPLGTAPILIGRSPTCTLVIDDDYCSAKHCRIFPENDEWRIEDLGSTNGTFLDNQRVSDPMPFKRGDSVRLGATALELRS